MTIGLNSILERDRIVFREHDGKALIYHPKTDQLYAVPAIGRLLLERCDGKKTIRESLEEIGLSQPLSTEALKKLVAFLQGMIARGVVEDKSSCPEPSGTESRKEETHV